MANNLGSDNLGNFFNRGAGRNQGAERVLAENGLSQRFAEIHKLVDDFKLSNPTATGLFSSLDQILDQAGQSFGFFIGQDLKKAMAVVQNLRSEVGKIMDSIL